MLPSSIFSFESRPKLRGVPWGLVVCIALLLLVELLVARSEWLWNRMPHSDVGVVDVLENSVLKPAEAAGRRPRIIFFGNSRTRDAVAPRLVEEHLGLPEGAVLNLGLTRGTAFDAEVLYRRNRDFLRDADVAFFGVDVIQLDGHLDSNERVRRFSTLGDRLRRFEGEERLALLAGWVWRTYDARDALRRWATSFWKKMPEGLPLSPDGRVEWRTEAINRAASRRSMSSYARQHFKDYQRDPGRRENLRRFVELLESDGIEVVILQVPVRDAYASASRLRYFDAMSDYEDDVNRVVGDRPSLRWWDATFAGLTRRDYYDYGHVRDEGARRLSRELADWIAHRYGARLDHALPPTDEDLAAARATQARAERAAKAQRLLERKKDDEKGDEEGARVEGGPTPDAMEVRELVPLAAPRDRAAPSKAPPSKAGAEAP